MSSYAITRKLDANTGLFELDTDGREWAAGEPATELVVRALRTPRGSCPLDPTYGIDVTAFARAWSNVGARVTAAIAEALAFLTRSGRIASLTVTVQTERDRLFYEVTFVDPRSRVTSVVPGSFVLGG